MAHSHIKIRRARTRVPVCRGGTLADYVPFYFGPRSPMLYAINAGAVEGCREGQAPILHLEGSASRIAAAELPFAFTDGHAVMTYSEFYDDLAELGNVDLALMNARYWNDTDADPDRKRRRQAEFLVYEFLPWNLVDRIGVLNENVRAQVEGWLVGSDHAPEVTVERSWYY